MRVREPVNGCELEFEALANTTLPALFTRLEDAIAHAKDAELFVRHKSDRASLRAALGLPGKGDFAGCYIFIDDDGPLYVGISRKVLRRISQHLNARSHYSASLVYRVAKAEHPHKMKRGDAMKDDAFRGAFDRMQERLQAGRVAFIEVNKEHVVPLYLLEVYAAMKLGTGRWNTFATH